MELITIGTEVLLDKDIPAKVTAISIRGIENYVCLRVCLVGSAQ